MQPLLDTGTAAVPWKAWMLELGQTDRITAIASSGARHSFCCYPTLTKMNFPQSCFFVLNAFESELGIGGAASGKMSIPFYGRQSLPSSGLTRQKGDPKQEKDWVQKMNVITSIIFNFAFHNLNSFKYRKPQFFISKRNSLITICLNVYYLVNSTKIQLKFTPKSNTFVV